MGIAEIVERGAGELGINISAEAGLAFETYYALLDQRRKNFNLTAISGAEEVARTHFIDSIALLKYADFKNASVVDVGSGAGFPGVPIKIVEPTIKLTLLDATEKRIIFLSELCAMLGIKAEYVNERAEVSARSFAMRERFDIVLSRAVAKLNLLCELCIPLTRVGGVFLAMKGVDSTLEMQEALRAIQILGAEINGANDYLIPGTEITHKVISIRKISKTPDEYPRRFAKMQRMPL